MNRDPAVNPYSAPRAQAVPERSALAHPSAYVDGAALAIASGFAFPPVCLKCGAHQDVGWLDHEFRYMPPWAWLASAFLRITVVRQSRFRLPLCQPCERAWKKWMRLLLVSWIPGVLFGVLLACLKSRTAGIVAIPVGVVLFFGGIILATILVNRYGVRATRIDGEYSWLRGVHPSAMQQALLPHTGAGTPSTPRDGSAGVDP
jgi:hypothetical protein